ncbi:MetQ/NlpA family ABC transporter substrate-binding protein [Salipaludibacillus agaradhaerens]|uniref:MetQ/NlpA family ABC transporter substrate-binding protein n=1 Tax=Salipaludibacillus agaradhaerens TaxID=76935 RepID=UPI00215155A4|nr:MetQ/NlpA family ABC transporter substrate-binding protein [Salipaludibacillus agaradhaerens]MCR6108315.1 MetQ/NlpA family ABC transporter substrate-binding protein [Salipaludibacillus agaradhaerens]MCR6120340.1 MetQ/NlpA family ABC transporter substrate-binding protein [Salipaludibacillus agaradhaerens]UJW59353.1 MetQ/NlpA family ABC transporter substrate-binding protein [Bacillus sp. A116_S68]
MKKLLSITTVSLLGVLTACGGGNSEGEALSEEEISVGVTAGPHEEIMEKVAELAEEEGLTINVEVFNEYVMPNVALDEGDLDVNSFQHKPYLENFREDRGLDIVDVATTVNFPMGLYSVEVDDVADIEEGDTIGLPNDPTNGARALILFEDAGLITLDEEAGVAATVRDIEENPLDLEFVELEASQIPRQLDEVKAAAINTNYAIEHGYVPTEDSVFIEPEDSPWVNVIAVRAENKDDAVVAKLIEIYQSDEVKEFIEENFAGSVVASW